ncbi:MAG: 30S ribosome-binding factor RbfA [Peptostreptococcaceae bacterium]|nr:30S ribosome-binding factor RbfA [Peptostreptococcaceae bacterium]
MGKGYRQGRLGEEIRKIISELLLREIKDPRLSGMVSISAVQVTADGSYATAYISLLGLSSSSEASEEEKEEVLSAFRSAKGLIKREIGKQIKLRHVPEVLFKMDTSMEYGRHITKLIHDLGIEGNKNDNKDDEDEE